MGREENHLAWMQGMVEDRLPAPAFGATLELRPIEASLDRMTFAMPLREWMLNPAGVIHGGALAALLDSAMTLAVIARLDRSRIATTTTLTTHFVRPLFADGSEVQAVAEVLHCGRTHATARATHRCEGSSRRARRCRICDRPRAVRRALTLYEFEARDAESQISPEIPGNRLAGFDGQLSIVENFRDARVRGKPLRLVR